MKHSLCRCCVWFEDCSICQCLDEGVVTGLGGIARASDDIDIPWCLDPYDPEPLGLVDIDGRWYTELEALKVNILELLADDGLNKEKIL